MVQMRALAAAMVAGLAFGSPALAGKANDTLNLLMLRETDFVDRIHTNSRESQVFSSLIYDTLIYADPQSGKFSGLLAKSWTWVDPTTVDFELREGVKFHNGEAFDAEDVVQTIAFVINPANKLRQQEADFGNIVGAEKLGPLKVRVKLRKPDALVEYLFANRLLIWPNEYTAANGAQIHGSKPVGTGPYTMTSLQPGKSYALKRYNAAITGPRPKPAIANIAVRVVGDVQTQVAELTVGNENLSFDIPAELAESMKGNPKVSVAYGGSTRYTFLSLDAAGRSGGTPLKNLKVRQAIAYAIDRPAITQHLAGGGSQPLNAQCNAAQEMCLQDVTGYGYDPARAKQLLAEAGYPQGFEVSLLSSTDLKTIGEAVQGYLAAVGIKAKYELFTLPAWRNKFLKGESTISLLGWGGGSGGFGTDYALRIFYDQNDADYARDNDLTTLMNKAAQSIDKNERPKLYRELLTRINAQAYTVPLFGNGAVYVMSSDLAFTPPRLDSPDLTWARWK